MMNSWVLSVCVYACANALAHANHESNPENAIILSTDVVVDGDLLRFLWCGFSLNIFSCIFLPLSSTLLLFFLSFWEYRTYWFYFSPQSIRSFGTQFYQRRRWRWRRRESKKKIIIMWNAHLFPIHMQTSTSHVEQQRRRKKWNIKWFAVSLPIRRFSPSLNGKRRWNRSFFFYISFFFGFNDTDTHLEKHLQSEEGQAFNRH